MGNKIEIYKKFLLLVFAMYVYLGKGVAYSYMAEVTLIIGLIFLLLERKNIQLLKSNRLLILIFLLFFNLLFIFRGLFYYSVINVFRDSFILNYIFFSFILFLFQDNAVDFIKKIFKVYKYYPIITSVLYILSLNQNIGSISIFGPNHILYFKFGDMAVHLFITLLLQLAGYFNFNKKQEIINLALILFLFLIASSYSRGGMLAFIIALIIFLIKIKDTQLRKNMLGYLKYIFFSFIIILPLVIMLPSDENFQGRKTGLDQISTNVTSIVNDDEGTLSDNKIWRLLWWAKIIDYTFGGEYFVMGKGLGLSLAEDDDIYFESNDADLRSPHNYHLSILARYGVPIFILWCFWLIINFARIRTKNIPTLKLIFICVQIAFIFNASFDVFLEGPMGAFPFWCFVGLDLMCEAFNLYGNKYKLELIN
jgi:O-antigen ligase